jgi:glycine/D-amino acid oxidase-like deaminating enzyme
MPSHSAKQHRFMEAIAHNKAFAKKVHIPQKVGEDFVEADKGKHFSKGGSMKSNKMHELNQAKELRRIAAEEEREAKEMKRGGHAKKMADGGGVNPRVAALMARMAAPRRAVRAPMAAPAMAPAMAPGMKHGGKTMKHEGHEHHMKMAHHHLKMAMKAGGKTEEKGIPHSKDMGEKVLKHGGKAHAYARGGKIDSRMEPAHMEKAGDLRKGNKPHGEHVIQEKGHTRAMMPKMRGNVIGNGPIVNAKKHGGKIHHKK